MARTMKFRSGNIQVNVDKDVASSFENVVKNLIPKTRALIETELDKIEKNAKSRWLVRKEGSQGSREKIYTEVYVSPTMEMFVVAGNSAPYAWAIKVGVDPQNSRLKMDRRLADGLLFAPMKRASNKIARVFADEFTRLMK